MVRQSMERTEGPMPYGKTNWVKVSASNRSSPPRKKPAAIARAITTTVNRAVSSRLGHTDFLSSESVSCRKVTGLILPAAPGATGRVPRVDTLAMRFYLTSRWTL